MFKWEIRIGDGNEGTFLSGEREGENVFDILRDEAASDIEAYGEPDFEDGDVQGASLGWYEIDGAPALNGAAALIYEAVRVDDLP